MDLILNIDSKKKVKQIIRDFHLKEPFEVYPRELKLPTK